MIKIEGAQTNISNCLINKVNSSSSIAILNEKESFSVFLTDTTFTKNYGFEGAAIYLKNANSTIINSTFIENTS